MPNETGFARRDLLAVGATLAAATRFDKLLAAICEGRVGAVLSIEASRLARNGRDWHTLLEFCGLVGTLIVDEDGVYEPRSPTTGLQPDGAVDLPPAFDRGH